MRVLGSFSLYSFNENVNESDDTLSLRHMTYVFSSFS